MILTMLLGLFTFAAGGFAWTLAEYVIHGLLSHRYHTFATPLHDVHHRDPHAVFTVGAWVPAGAIWLGGLWVFGFSGATIFLTGLMAGFIAYEAIHYRFHFSLPATAWEARLRARHLAHHYREPNAVFGVTTPLWDRVFGSEPEPDRMTELLASVTDVAPLAGASNARKIWYYLHPAR